MSIVANVLCKYASWVVYDGRGRNSTTREITSETIKKAEMLNKNVCIAYTGTLEVANGVLGIVRAFSNGREPSDEVFNKTVKVLRRSSICSDATTSFLITGIDSNGDIASYTIKTDLTSQILIPKDDTQFSFVVLSTGNFNLSLSEYVLSAIKTSSNISNVRIVNAMKQFCCDVADLDDSVNKNLSVIEIRK